MKTLAFDSYKYVHDASAYIATVAMYYKRNTSVVLSDGIISEQLLLSKLHSYM